MPRPFWMEPLKLLHYSYYAPRADFVSRDHVFHSWVLIASEKGEFSWKTESRAGESVAGSARFGDLMVAAPGTPFWRAVTTPTLTYHVLQWDLVDAAGRPVEASLPVGRLPIRDTARLASTLAALKSYYLKADEWSVHRKTHLLAELLQLAWQTRIEPAPVADPDMEAAAELLARRAGEAFSMEEISASFGLGPVQFTRRFRAAHGRNPIQYLTAARLEIAQRLLIETTLSLDEIAARCGWSSGAYLSQVFTGQLLITPGRFRASRRV